MQSALDPCEQWLIELRQKRRGVFVVIMAVSLAACLAFVAFSVDTGMVVLTQTRMQNCVDAAALAAANEIGYAVEHAGSNVSDVTAYALDQARLKAQSVGALNGIHIDPATDVQFGRWQLNSTTGASSITWDVTPSNAVKVQARRTNSNTAQPDGQLKTLFAGVFGTKSVSITSSGTAYIESRDIALVLDFSSSMNDDSSYDVLGARDRTSLDANMQQIYNQLDAVRDFGTMTFTPQWFQKTVTSGTKNGTVTFKNTSIDYTTSAIATGGIQLQFTDNTTETKTPTTTSGTYSRTGTAKTINKVTANFPGTLAPATGTGSSGSGASIKTVSVVFNNNTSNAIAVTTNINMTRVKLNYQGGTSLDSGTFTGTKTKTVTGSGLYVSSVAVTVSGTVITVNNPAGTSAPSSFAATSLVFDASATNIQSFLGLGSVTYPWGSGSWSEFIGYCQTDSQINSAGHQYKYGGACLVNYLLKNKYTYASCSDLWRTSHYPFHSVKQGAQLFCTFLGDLGFGDEVGAVSYDVNSRREEVLNYDGYNINIASNPVCSDFTSVSQIIGHRQAAHYSGNTNIGAGIHTGKLMLDASKRSGTRPTMLVMTDGLPTAQDSGWTNTTTSWNWDTMFDYDGDGVRDFHTTDSNAIYGLIRAKEAVDAGYTIHTMTVGLGGDPTYMEAIAHLGGGITITIPGNQTVSEMEADVLAAFQKIAAFVPPARLVKPD